MKDQEKTHHPHDRGYKRFLSFLKIFQQLIEGYVDADWKNDIDFSRSQRIEKTFITKEMAEQESDILYKVPSLKEGKETYFYILIEHQSTVDHSMAFRVLSYLVQVWYDIYKNIPQNERRKSTFSLPPVFALVLYNGDTSWTASTVMKDLVEKNEFLGDFVPNVRYQLIDIPRLDQQKLKKVGNTLSGVFLLESKNLEEQFKKIIKESLAIIFKEPNKEILEAIIDWVIKGVKERFPEPAKKIIESLDLSKTNIEEVRTMLETIPEKIYGSAQKDSIILVLEARFGKVPKELKDAIKNIDSYEILESLVIKTGSVNSLDEFKTALGKITK